MRSSHVCFPRLLKTLAFVPAFALLLHGCASGGGRATLPPRPDPISVLTSTLPNGQVGTPYSATLAATGGTAPYTWSLTGGTLPAGLSLGSTGAITGTPTAVVTSTPLTLKVTDSGSPALTQSANLTLTITSGPLPISVSISPTTVSILVATGTQAFTASVQNDSQNMGVTWTLTGAGCSGATCGTLSNVTTTSVTYTAPAAVPSPASVTLTATSVADNTKSGSATITVTSAPLPISVSVSPTTASILVATGTQAFTASVQNDSQNRGVTWALTGAGCSGATCGTLSNVTTTSVKYTAPAAVPSASVTLTATSIADITKTFSATITVTTNPVIVVTIAPTNPSVQTGIGMQNFTATLQNDSQNKGVTWALSGAGCSAVACGTLSNVTTTSVTYTAPANQPTPNTVTLTATSVADNTKISSTTITLTPPVSVSVAPTSASVAVSATKQFTPTVSNDAQNKGVTWSLSGAGCSGAMCGAISSTGLYTAPSAAPSPATVTVTTTSVSDPSRTATATVTVIAAVAIVVTVSPANQSVQTSGTQNFTASLQNDSQNKGVTWSLSGSGCSGATCGTLSNVTTASVTYTAPAAVPSPATVTLTAESVADTTKAASATITVISGSITVSISPKRAGLTVTQGLPVTATTNDGAGVNWTATGGNFSLTTSLTGVTVTYTAPGSAGSYTLTATSVSDNTQSASVTVGVTDLTGVTTYHNNLSRDGTNTQEYALTTSNVTSSTFGKLFSCTIDSPAYTQPLWVRNLTIGGGTHNVVFVASSRDTVYAFDADKSPCVTYWQISLLGSNETYLNNGDVNTDDIHSDIGIVGTPVIDLSTQTLYVVSKSKDSGTSCTPSASCHQRLHALNLADHAEKFGGPYSLTSSITVAGTGDGSSNGQVPFDPLRENQRPGLALVNGVVYIAWASHGDNGPYHGWVIGFAANNIGAGPSAKWNSTPNAVNGFNNSDGGIWMSGGAPAADFDSSNNIYSLYFLTGNGSFNASSGGSNYGDSTIKLSTSGSLHVTDYFTPSDQLSLNNVDADHGAGGAAILVDQPSGPVHHLLIGGGKAGTLFLVNRDNMGHFNSGSNNVVQSLNLGNPIFATGAFWNNSFYIAGLNGRLNQYTFNTGTGQFASSATHFSPSSFGFPGSTPSVSSLGSSTNGIVWALDNSQYCTAQSPGCGPTVLHAYDASNVSTELWNSTQGSGNGAGNAVKFTVPTVANGKVYVPTRSELTVYSLLPN